MSWMRDTYPDGPCDECNSLVSVESFEYDDQTKEIKMLCDPCWKEACREEATEKENSNGQNERPTDRHTMSFMWQD